MRKFNVYLFSLSFLVSILIFGCSKSDNAAPGGGSEIIGAGSVVISGVAPGDPQESIYVRKVGHGPKTIVLIPGNNTSGMAFEPMLEYFRSIDSLDDAYTVYTFDYRGSGYSSYNKKITSLKDFALDFEKVMNQLANFPTSGVTIVGYSMGFGVALEMIIANPGRYSNIVSLTGIGTRGVRVWFNAATAGTDSLGQVWAPGDWVTVSNDANGLTGAEFQQRSWQGPNRTYANVEFTWDLVVFEDILKYNISTFAVTDPTFQSNLNYENALIDGLYIQYMPESLYYSHKFNVSRSNVTNTNADSTVVIIPGDSRLGTILTGKNAMIVKATTDFVNWRGDQVIYDNYAATTKYDLKQAGATVNAVIIDADQGYDHGFPIVNPLQTVNLIDTFIKGTLSAGTASTALGGSTINYYPHSETTWETDIFTGF